MTSLNKFLIFALATTCGAVVANLYYAQTLILLIGKAFGINVQLCGVIVTLSQVGYGIGLLFVVPLADIFENKKLILTLLLAVILSLISVIVSSNEVLLLFGFFLLGMSSSVVQIIVPFVTHFTPVENRGMVIGRVMSGLLVGIMLARPLASFLSDLFAWKAVFIFSILIVALSVILLYAKLPNRVPGHNIKYRNLVRSLPNIFMKFPILRRRAIYHAILFGVFSLFWTSVAIYLVKQYGYTQSQVALFAFVGAGGALVAPFAGKLADSGFIKMATGVAILMVMLSCIIALIEVRYSILLLIISALLLDMGISLNLVLGQRAIYALAPEIRARLNGLYMSIFFIGGAIGSGLSGFIYTHGGWNATMKTAIVACICVFIYFLSEVNFRRSKNNEEICITKN